MMYSQIQPLLESLKFKGMLRVLSPVLDRAEKEGWSVSDTDDYGGRCLQIIQNMVSGEK